MGLAQDSAAEPKDDAQQSVTDVKEEAQQAATEVKNASGSGKPARAI